MKIFIYHSGHTEFVKKIVRALGEHVEIATKPDSDCDFFFSLQMGDHAELIRIRRTFPHVKFITYAWDCYEWIWEHERHYDWKGYGDLCKVSDEVWVPSHGQVLRLKQHWGIEKYDVVKCYAQFFNHSNVHDGGYVCDPLREIPDRHRGWIAKACAELNIPYKHGGRKRGQRGTTWEEYKDFIAGASFIVCPWYEASTGGMSLLEGYHLGKEVLICRTPYQGAADYFGDRAHYFDPTYESLKENLQLMWDNRKKDSPYPLSDRKEFCIEFALESFAKRLHDKFLELNKA